MNKTALRVDPNTAYKLRVKKIRKQLPKNVRSMITEKFRKYNTGPGIALIDNVLAGKSADMELTEILEGIAEEQKGGSK